MIMKHFLVLFFICYTPTVNSIATKQIQNLWDAIHLRFDHIFYSDLVRVYTDEKPNELKAILENYGSRYNKNGIDELAMNLEQFTRAASDGYIQRWTKQAVYTEFVEIIPEEEKRDYITLNDMIEYYESSISVSQLDDVIEKYGKLVEGEYRLYANNFRRALNMDLLPKPLCEEGGSLEAMYDVYQKILDKSNVFSLNKTALTRYYEDMIKQVFSKYGSVENKSGIRFEEFINAIASGDLPISNLEDGSQETMHGVYQRILDKNNVFSLNKTALTRYYEDKIDNVFSKYGSVESDSRMRFGEFKKAITSGDLPISNLEDGSQVTFRRRLKNELWRSYGICKRVINNKEAIDRL